ncbi:MAG: TIGR04222 domain-containing membrane protein [Pseudanabaena sp.]
MDRLDCPIPSKRQSQRCFNPIPTLTALLNQIYLQPKQFAIAYKIGIFWSSRNKPLFDKIYPAVLIACLLGLGIAKTLVGLSRGKPVGILIAMCAIVAIIGLVFSQKAVHRSRYGDRFLSNLRNHIPNKGFSLNDVQLPLVVALLSIAILPNDAFADLKSLLTPVSNSGGDGIAVFILPTTK